MVFKRRIRDASTGPTTYIAAGTAIVGTISGRGPYVFCGIVEGECDVDGLVTIAAGCEWRGTLRATDIVVAGSVEGDVVAQQCVELTATARVAGSLSGRAIAVAEGAVIEGEINMTSGGAPSRFEEKRQP